MPRTPAPSCGLIGDPLPTRVPLVLRLPSQLWEPKSPSARRRTPAEDRHDRGPHVASPELRRTGRGGELGWERG